MKKRVVVALGHRALGTTLPEQLEAVKKISESNCRSYPERISGKLLHTVMHLRSE